MIGAEYKPGDRVIVNSPNLPPELSGPGTISHKSASYWVINLDHSPRNIGPYGFLETEFTLENKFTLTVYGAEELDWPEFPTRKTALAWGMQAFRDTSFDWDVKQHGL